MVWSKKDFHLLKQAMTNFVRSDKQVLARQAAEMSLSALETREHWRQLTQPFRSWQSAAPS